jgi:hypothetical protein
MYRLPTPSNCRHRHCSSGGRASSAGGRPAAAAAAPPACASKRRPTSLSRPSSSPAAAAAAAAAAPDAPSNQPREVAVLGGEDFIYSQKSGVEVELFKGSVLGVDADVARVDFRQTLGRSLAVSFVAACGGGA